MHWLFIWFLFLGSCAQEIHDQKVRKALTDQIEINKELGARITRLEGDRVVKP